MGCKQSFPLSQKGAHERDCAFLQLKCPFHGQCVFNGSLADVVPHLAAEHAVTPVPVQPAGTLFYRAKNFYRRNIWTLIYSWDRPSNLFRFIVKHVHATQVGRTDNCNLLIAHIQYIGPESMASRYDYRKEFHFLSAFSNISNNWKEPIVKPTYTFITDTLTKFVYLTLKEEPLGKSLRV